VNSAKEFQNVTKVSDSLLNVILISNFRLGKPKKLPRQYKSIQTGFAKKENIVLIDINQATKEDLVKSMELAMLFLRF
jgi:hypothetical protein